MCFYEFFKVFGYFLEIKCDDAGIINYYLLFIYNVRLAGLRGSSLRFHPCKATKPELRYPGNVKQVLTHAACAAGYLRLGISGFVASEGNIERSRAAR